MTIVYTIPAVRNAWADTAPVWNGTTGDISDPGNTYVTAGWQNTTVPPPYQIMNWALNWLGQAIRYYMQNGIPDWQTGDLYQTGSIVVFNNLVFQSLINNNTGNSPPATLVANANWGPLASYATVAMLANYVTITTFNTTLANYAALASPPLSGTPTAPTASPATLSNTQIANTAFVQSALAAALGTYLTVAAAAAQYVTYAALAADNYLSAPAAATIYLTQTAAASTYATFAYVNGSFGKSTSAVWELRSNGIMTIDGVTPSLTGGSNAVVFPVTTGGRNGFPTVCVSVQVTPVGTSGGWAITGLAPTEFTMNTGEAEPYYYHAVGY